jgi:general secretion pathway protein M
MTQRWQKSRWVRGLAFVVANAAVGLVVAIVLVMPIRDGLARRDIQIAEQRTMLTRFRTLAAQEPAVEAAGKQVLTETGEYLGGNNEGVINADLQTRLKGMVEPAGARLRSVRTLPPQTAEQVRYIGSRIEIYGPLPAIHRAVAAIEASKPYLFVRGVVIKPAPPAGRHDIPQEPVIEAQLDVFGAVRSAGSN